MWLRPLRLSASCPRWSRKISPSTWISLGLGDEDLTPSAEGSVIFDIDRGRFIQIDAAGAPMRVLGLLNFSALARRLRFDFSDVYKRGLVFDEIEGGFVSPRVG